QRRIDRHRRRAGAIHLSPHAKHTPRPRIWKSFHVITNVGTRNARLGSFSRIFPDLTGLASEFAFQLTAKAFAHAIRDRAGNAASFWKAASSVIPSEVEESLAIQEIIRDVSVRAGLAYSLNMTEMRGKNTAEGSGSQLREPKGMGPNPPLIN